MFKNWIFDWSGTLVDDMALVVSATNHVMRAYGKAELNKAEFRSQFRLPYAEFYEEVLPGVPLDEIEDHFRAGFEIADDAVPVLPHAKELLQLLAHWGHRIFVLTSMDAVAFEEQQIENGLDQFFEKTYAGVQDKRCVIGELLENHGLDPRETVFVGDMKHDVDTAHHGGVASIALLTGYNDAAELSESRPTMLLQDLSALVSLVNEVELRIDRRPISTVGALIRNQDGELLMIRTHKWSNLWGIPGGKIRRGECGEDALRREILEETCLEISDIKFVCVQDSIDSPEFMRPAHFLLLNYTAFSATTKVVLNEEAQEFRWLSAEEAWKLPLNYATQCLLEQVNHPRPREN